MKLEQAVNRIENALQYKDACYQDLQHLNTMRNNNGNDKVGLETHLRHALIEHHNFYYVADKLDEWVNAEFPDPKEYGQNASMWLKCKKRDFLGKVLTIGGATAGAAGSFIDPVYAVPGAAAFAVGLVMRHDYGRRSRELLSEDDVQEYAKDFMDFVELGQHFKDENLRLMMSTANKYSFSLNMLNKYLRSTNQNSFDALIKNPAEADNFLRGMYDIVKTISKSKKNPLPAWYCKGIISSWRMHHDSPTVQIISRLKNSRKTTDELADM